MLARAVAAEAGVPFHHASGSEFVEKYVGVGARRIRDLFAQARKLGRGVIFFDEFDAIGKARGGPNSHEEREQTLNQLLVELDGFGTTEDVIVIAATNRLDTLDSAVLRPGRFNRKIHVGLPDVIGRKAIFAVHSREQAPGRHDRPRRDRPQDTIASSFRRRTTRQLRCSFRNETNPRTSRGLRPSPARSRSSRQMS